MRRRLAFVSVAILIGALAWMKPGPASAVMIGFDPASPLSVTSGVPISVDVVVSDLGGEIVSAFDLDVLFDTSFLSATGVTFGTELGDPFFFEALTDSDIDNVGGSVNIAEVSLLSDAQLDALQGDSVALATLDFDVLQTGDTPLSISFGPLQDVKGRDNTPILPVETPAPASLLLLGTGLLGIGLVSPRTRGTPRR